jgi:hypothetical protein
MSLTTIAKIVARSSLPLLLLLLLVRGGESANASVAELTSTFSSSPFNTTSIVNTTRPFNNTSTFGQVPFEPLPQQPQQLLPQQPQQLLPQQPQQPEVQAQVTTQDRIQETLNALLTTNTSITVKTLLLAELEQSIENLTSNQYDVTADFTEGDNGGQSYLISIESIIDDPVIEEEEEEEEEEGEEENGNDNGSNDNDGGNGDGGN